MNEYHARISPHVRNQLLRCFVNEVTATTAGISCKVNRHTADRWYRFFRQIIFEHQSQLRRLSGEIEADHSYFGARGRRRYTKEGKRFVPRKRQKFVVFSFLERRADGNHVVVSRLIKKPDTETLMPLTRLIVEKGARIYTDSWSSFNGLESDGYVHRKVNHKRKQLAKRDGEYSVHTGTVDQYFKVSKQRLSKFGALHPETIHLYLAECDFRYNNKANLTAALKKLLLAQK